MNENTTQQTEKQNKRKRILLLACLSAVVIIGVIIAIMALNAPPPQANLDNTEKPVVEGSAKEVQITYDPNIGDLAIDTPYCVLRFPAKWSESISVSAKQTKNAYAVIFTGKLDEQEVDLFSVVFGESTEMPIGKLIQPDGSEVVVRLNVDMFDPSDLTEEQIETAYKILDSNTYLIEALAELDNFS